MGKHGSTTIQSVPISKIKLGRNSRKDIRDEELSGLMQSIKETGLLQPIGVVRKADHYEVCYGNRRFLACSKLGATKIAVVIHEDKKASDTDMKNLTENIQRRNISLGEAGRYMALLQKDGLSSAEIAARLGVEKTYVNACMIAYREVPEKYRKDIVTTVNGPAAKKRIPGKIAVGTAQAIVSAKKSYRLTNTEAEVLFKAAKSDERFSSDNVRSYASKIKSGIKDPIGATKQLTYVAIQFWMEKDELDKLKRTYVDDGPFRSINGLAAAVLSGKKSVHFKIINK